MAASIGSLGVRHLSRHAKLTFTGPTSIQKSTSQQTLKYNQHILLPKCTACCMTRSLSTTSVRLKKGGKSNTSKARSDSSPPVDKSTAMQTPVDEAFDVSELEARILNAMEKLTHRLATLRQGGKLNPDDLLKLDVMIGKGEKEKVKLQDVAQIIPRGRYIDVIVGDEEYVKPVTTAIQASKHSLNPEGRKADNPLTITVPIPPPTREARKDTVDEARKVARDAEDTIQHARQGHHKKLKQKLAGELRPDDLKKASKLMEDTVKRGKEEVKRILDGVLKVLDQH